MFIQTQDTPNPATLKFIPGVPVMAQGTADFADSDSANTSPLARRLFQVDGVTAVFLGADFVAVTKAEGLDWFALKPGILAGIMEHYASGMPVIEKDAELADPHAEDGDSDTVQQIKQLLDSRVRPAVAMDGGDRPKRPGPVKPKNAIAAAIQTIRRLVSQLEIDDITT